MKIQENSEQQYADTFTIMVRQMFWSTLKVIERAHRIKKKENSENSGKLRTTVCRYLHYNGKTNVLKYAKTLKGNNIFIDEDFSHETKELRTELGKKVKKT